MHLDAPAPEHLRTLRARVGALARACLDAAARADVMASALSDPDAADLPSDARGVAASELARLRGVEGERASALAAARSELRAASRAVRCGARCRDGHPCGAPGRGRGGRCKLHGGASTGPRTAEGQARALAALGAAPRSA